MDKMKQYVDSSEREPFKDAAAWAAKFAREMGMRRRAGFNPYGFELFEPALESGLVGQVAGFTEPNFNGFGL